MSNPLQWHVLVSTQIPVVTNDLPPGLAERRWSPISATLIAGDRDAVLADTFITVEQNRTLAEWIAASGKNLTTIYATHGHGDHFFGVNVQVLSYPTPATQPLSAAEAVPLARNANDQLAAAVAAHPDRFVGFATLPTPDPQAAAAELKRAVQQLGFKGAMINGRTNDRFLDDSRFYPILEAAETLDVPIYIHPTYPSKAVLDDYYSGFDPVTTGWFATTTWGWHMETGIHALRMILAGIFDRYPRLQIILGHWGEFIPFYLARLDQLHQFKQLKQRMSDYFLQNFYVTPSGLYTYPPFLLTLQTIGADRIMYSVDYPYVIDEHARTFLENAPISPADKEKIAHGNAERVLKL